MLPRPLPRASAVWVAIIGGVVALDIWADQGEPDLDTLTEFARRIFATHTRLGRAAFALTLLAGGDLLYLHVTKPI